MRERDNDAWIWLTQERGLRPFWIKQFQLGLVDDPVRGHERYVGRVSIPYLTGLGEARGLRFRRLDDRRPKYEGLGGVETHLFAPRYSKEPLVYVIEGEINAITIHQIGLRAVGVPGAVQFKKEWKWTFRDAQHVVGVVDGQGDPSAAHAFKTRLAQHLRNVVPSLSFIQMPDGHDANSLYVENRRALRRLLEVK